jgi:hypothetical protein
MTIMAPSNRSRPPGTLFVRPDGTDPRAGSDHDGSEGFLRYIDLTPIGRKPGEPAFFLLHGVDRDPLRQPVV